jgi:hypothetical protein
MNDAIKIEGLAVVKCTVKCNTLFENGEEIQLFDLNLPLEGREGSMLLRTVDFALLGDILEQVFDAISEAQERYEQETRGLQ